MATVSINSEPMRKISPGALVVKMREKIAVLEGHRPLRVVCDVCEKIIVVPMKKLSRRSCLALLRSIDFPVGGKERIEILHDIIDQTIVDGRLKDLSKARGIPKRCEEHYRCSGDGVAPCPRGAALIPDTSTYRQAFGPSRRKQRGSGGWLCVLCSAGRRDPDLFRAAGLKCYALKTPEQRKEWAEKISSGRIKAVAARTPEQRANITRKRMSSLTKEQRSEASRRANASITPERRADITRKRLASMTPESRSEASRKANASKTPEQRSDIAKKRSQSMTPERRSEIARKARASIPAESRKRSARKAAQKRLALQTSEQRSAQMRKAWVTRKQKANPK